MIEVTASSLAVHPFLRGMPRELLVALAPAARTVALPDKFRLFEAGGNATRFWLIQAGRVALDVDVPGNGRVVIEQLGMGELLGWSWLIPPCQWAFGAVTMGPVQAIEFDAPAVRSLCEGDPLLASDLDQRLLRVLARRLRATRIRLVTGIDGGIGSL